MIPTRYITVGEFNDYFGIDLGKELHSENPSNAAEAFIARIEDRMDAFINRHFFIRMTDRFQLFSDWQRDHYKKALLEQAYYVFNNGDISTDSFLDPETGVKASREDVIKYSIAPNAIDHLIECGVWDRNIRKSVMMDNLGWWLNGH